MNKKLVIGIIVIVAIVGLIYFVARKPRVAPVIIPSPQNSIPASKLQSPQPPTLSPKATPTSKPTIKPKPIIKAVITAVVLSQAIDATSGAPVNPVTTLSANAPTLYAVLTLKNTIQRTKLSYTRYYNGKYVDANVSHPTRDGVRYFHFEFKLKSGQTQKAGNYTLNFYVNGKKAQSVSYVVVR